LVTSDAARDQEAPGSIRRLVCLFSSSGQAVFVEGLGVWRCIENRPELPLDSAHKKPAWLSRRGGSYFCTREERPSDDFIGLLQPISGPFPVRGSAFQEL